MSHVDPRGREPDDPHRGGPTGGDQPHPAELHDEGQHHAAGDPHRPMGLELDALDTADRIAAEERQASRELPVVFRVIDWVVKTVMVVLLIVLVIAVGANVFGRFVLNQSVAGTDEMSRFLFIWVIFLGAALAHLHNEHIAVSLFVERLPHAMQRAAVILQELIILAVVVALLVSAREVMATAPGTSALLDVPLWLINLSVPFSAALMGLVTLYRIAVALRPSQDRKA